eukprot:CAMPEP_0119391404 /NCGR_PEP_ID=MMETSP1334-20130426/116946_1 /TAXON_ID=127549 /ORGANISM="Calcidiscus leptoporus, Strain RCC1130" /LENGTH=87 /DNA_ID=CAMNT_0007414073 /DNA_START=214 /DNA_END=473 /DNA_ORIENTATION=+
MRPSRRVHIALIELRRMRVPSVATAACGSTLGSLHGRTCGAPQNAAASPPPPVTSSLRIFSALSRVDGRGLTSRGAPTRRMPCPPLR